MKDRSISQFRSVLVLSATAALIAIASFSFISVPAAAGDDSLTVFGYVTDGSGDPVVGADVFIEVQSGTYPSRTATTGSDGGYMTSPDFSMSEWNTGDVVEVTVTYGGDQEVATGSDDGDGYLQIDVVFTTEIPEFGSLAGVLVTMGIVGVIATASMRRKKA